MGGRPALATACLAPAPRFAVEAALRGGGCGGGVAGDAARRGAVRGEVPARRPGDAARPPAGFAPLRPARPFGVSAVGIGCASSISATGRTRPSPWLARRLRGGGDGGCEGS